MDLPWGTLWDLRINPSSLRLRPDGSAAFEAVLEPAGAELYGSSTAEAPEPIGPLMVQAIPFSDWRNRNASSMRVWIPVSSQADRPADGGGAPKLPEGESFAGSLRLEVGNQRWQRRLLPIGIHTMRGIPKRAVAENTPILGADASAQDVASFDNTCDWNPDMLGLDWANPASRSYYQSTLDMYADWGVDFIKCDDMLWPYQAKDIEEHSSATERSGRPMQLSLSPGRDLSLTRLDDLREHATMWRICDDLWDSWDDVEANFGRFARWAPHASPQGWPDGDMLPLGRIGIRAERGEPRDSRLPLEEQRTLLALWVIARSPLTIGGHLPTSDPQTLELFKNDDVLSILTHATRSREILREDDRVYWVADGDQGQSYFAVFNTGSSPLRVLVDSQDVGLPAALTGQLTDLWSGERLPGRVVKKQSSDQSYGVTPGSTGIELDVPAHGVRLVRYDP